MPPARDSIPVPHPNHNYYCYKLVKKDDRPFSDIYILDESTNLYIIEIALVQYMGRSDKVIMSGASHHH